MTTAKKTSPGEGGGRRVRPPRVPGSHAGAVSEVVLDPGGGPIEAAELYLRYAADGWPVKGDGHIQSVRTAFDVALTRDAFEKMEPDIGARGEGLKEGQRPTLMAAHELGFEVQELRLLFRSPERELVMAGLTEPPE